MLSALWLVGAVAAQDQAVLWDFDLDTTTARAGEAVTVRLTATPVPPWYFYAHTLKAAGPTPAQFKFDVRPELRALDGIEAPPASKKFDQGFQVEVEYYHDEVTFQQKFAVGEKAAPGSYTIKGTVQFQACNDTQCLPPKEVPFELDLTIESGPPREQFRAPAAPSVTPASPAAVSEKDRLKPELRTIESKEQIAASRSSPSIAQAMQSGLLTFLLLAILQGFLALATPCVYPMIPVTVSFFLKQGERKGRRPLLLAAVYAASIILTFTSVGILLTIAYGPTGMSRIASSPTANLVLGVVFVAFALSLFGLFEIQVPPSLQSYFAAKGRGGGYNGAVLMGVAFTLASFACTAPFIGALLGLAAQGFWFWPVTGMVAFSFAFALPFFLLALFPQLLARMPKSGGWLNSVKVVMGFLVLAISLKFLVNADMVWKWEVLTRAVVLATWAVVAAFAGIYLLGMIRLPHDSPLDNIGVLRMLLAMAFLIVALYFAYGLLGGKINGTVDAFLPAAAESAATGQATVGPVLDWTDNYSRALQRAKAEHKPILIDFTGITCTNCKWMERNIFVREDVARAMQRFVLVRLQTDNGSDWKKNQKMQVDRFGTAALPFYVIMSPDDREIARLAGLTRDPARFVAFLDEGVAAASPVLPKRAFPCM